MKCHAFTLSKTTIVDRLITPVQVFDKYNNQDLNLVPKWEAVWDTGATTTCITANLATDIGLIPNGTVQISTAGGDKECNTYCIDILLPNNILIENLRVYEVHLNTGDLLIGMDVIKYGDFTISNYDGKTKLTFRIPSQGVTDYVADIRNAQTTN